jgi:uncharacterized oligopeptide transporter (OPT) family protein
MSAEASMSPTLPAAVAPPLAHGLTARSIVSGGVLAILLCFMNSYLTLSFGVIEEGPTIAALFFFAVFFMSKLRITPTEMVVVASMGSAGGSLGFISNFFAAKAMIGVPYTLFEMTAFGVISSLVGLVMVVPLRQLLVIREQLPWPGAKATAGVITALVEEGDPRQPKILLVTTLSMMAVVILNTDGGYGLLPEETRLPLIGVVGGAIAWSPFATAGSYLMGMRTCVGFLLGACALMVMGHLGWVPDPSAPHKFFWPGLGFLVAGGVVGILMNWRSFVDSFRSIAALGEKTDDADPVMSGRTLIIGAAVSFVVCATVMKVFFHVSLLLTVVLVGVGGFVQNVISTRAQAITAFNPARVMGILVQGVTAAFGGRSASINLTGAGFVAGSGAQAGMMTNDFAYGRLFRVPSRWQFWLQVVTVLPCSLVAAYAFQKIADTHPMTLTSTLPAPVAKMWAASAQIFDGTYPLPPNALKGLAIGGLVGVVYVAFDSVPRFAEWMPESTGVGLGLVLSVSYGLTFFLGGFLMWVVLGRWFKVKDVSLTTIAVGCIVAEGIGGVLKPLMTMAGLIPSSGP